MIYLAGSMSYFEQIGQPEKASRWREYIQQRLGHKFKIFNPNIYCETSSHTDKSIVNQNIAYLKKTDITIVNLEAIEKSEGTIFELAYSYLYHIPVIAYSKERKALKPHVSACIDIYFDDLDELVNYVSITFGQ